jgi:hypothetical protein
MLLVQKRKGPINIHLKNMLLELKLSKVNGLKMAWNH